MELPKYLELVDKKLKESAKTDSPALKAAASRFIDTKGMRLRPSLVITIAASSGNEIVDKAISAAAAIELLHIGSLVHDDIMDEGLIRWGIPTISSKEGVNTAILAGDYFLAKASALASSVSAEAGVLIAETIAKMCEGQSQELADRFNTERTVDSLLLAIKGKTSSLFSAACVLGGLCAGLKDNQLHALAEYGENFGTAFQILDDVQDFISSSEKSGKSIGADVREGNCTLPVLLSLRGPQKDKLKQLLQSKDISSDEVLEILRADGSIEKALTEAARYQQKAYGSLAKLGNERIASALVTLKTD